MMTSKTPSLCAWACALTLAVGCRSLDLREPEATQAGEALERALAGDPSWRQRWITGHRGRSCRPWWPACKGPKGALPVFTARIWRRMVPAKRT